MRAIAVVAVVLYHVGLLQGGFVGVDVFFVVSGFLITALLWRELATTHRVGLGSFYGRRARRLLPASLLVIAVTLVASAAWLAPLDARSVVGDARAATLYVANYRFIAQHTNYLAPHAASPLQHYWSLAVEEQFYLLWPLLLVALAWTCRRRAGAMCAILAALGAVSFALLLHWTHASPAWAFFSAPSRAWELIAGALIAFAAPRLVRLRASVALALTWVGLAAIVWSLFAIASTAAFPGTVVVVPVVGTVCVLAGGCAAPQGGAGVVLDRKPMQFLGGISYAWYLWHWPVIVLVPFAVGDPLGSAQKLGLAVVSCFIAFVTVLVVERPVRFSSPLSASSRRSIALGVALMLGSLLVASSVAASLPSLAGHGTAEVLAPTLAPAQPLSHKSAAGDDAVSRALVRAVGEHEVPANLMPSLTNAARDKAAPFLDGCDDSFSDTVVHRCVYGDPNGSKTIVLFGDSHAAMYEPVFDLVAKMHHWRLVSISKATCTPYIERYFSPILGREFAECEQFRNAAYARIAAEHPALVVVSAAHHYGPEYQFQVYSDQWFAGMERAAKRLETLAEHVVILGPAPRPPGDVPSCLSAHLTRTDECALPRATATNPLGMYGEAAAAHNGGAQYVDVTPWYCTDTTCPAIVGNLLVYRDDNHITTTYGVWLAPRVEALVAAALGT